MLYLIVVVGSSALRVSEIAKINRTEKAMKPELFRMYMVVATVVVFHDLFLRSCPNLLLVPDSAGRHPAKINFRPRSSLASGKISTTTPLGSN